MKRRDGKSFFQKNEKMKKPKKTREMQAGSTRYKGVRKRDDSLVVPRFDGN